MRMGQPHTVTDFMDQRDETVPTLGQAPAG